MHTEKLTWFIPEYYFFILRKIDNRNKWKNYVVVFRVKLSVELNVLLIREQPIFI